MTAAYLRIGLIVRPHGLRGAVKLLPLTDDPARFTGLTDAFIEQSGAYRPVRVCEASARPDAVTLRVADCQSAEEAEKLRGAYLCVDRAHAVCLPPDTYFVCDLIGCETFDTRGHAYGRVTDVYETGANDVYEIENGRLLVPALKRVLYAVDTAGARIVFDSETLEEVGLFAD